MEIIDSIKNILLTSENPDEDLMRMLDVGLQDPMEEEKTLSGAEQEISDWVRKALCERGFIKAKIELLTKGISYQKLELYDEIITRWQKENAQKINKIFPPEPSLYKSLPDGVDPKPDLDF
jgi:hypothetical protein